MSIEDTILSLLEAKAVGTRRKPKKPDLRALELSSFQIAEPKKYKKITQAASAVYDRQYQNLKLNFARDLTRIYNTVKNGGGKATSAATFRKSYQEAFRLGMMAQGVGELKTNRSTVWVQPNLTADDRLWIESAVAEEISYWRNFMVAVREGSSHMPEDVRLNMYVDALDSIFNAGKVQALPELTLIHWVFGHAEHCPECVYLSEHSPYTKDSLPTTPRSGSTRCLSNCKCTLVFQRTSQRVYDRIRLKQQPRSVYLRTLKNSKKREYGMTSKLLEVANDTDYTDRSR